VEHNVEIAQQVLRNAVQSVRELESGLEIDPEDTDGFLVTDEIHQNRMLAYLEVKNAYETLQQVEAGLRREEYRKKAKRRRKNRKKRR
jgi:CelD/BcsL family acetyltransferase involved in cellulose biosynthesis